MRNLVISDAYMNTLVSSLFVLLVLLFDAAISYYASQYSKNLNVFSLIRISLVILAFVPNLITLFLISSFSDPRIFNILFECQLLIVLNFGQITSYFIKSELYFKSLIIPSALINAAVVSLSWLQYQSVHKEIGLLVFFLSLGLSIIFLFKAMIILGDMSFDAYSRIGKLFLNFVIATCILKFILVICYYRTKNGTSSNKYAVYYNYGYIFCVTLLLLRAGNDMSLENMRNKVSSEVKRTFVRYVSHKVRTPLNVILMGLRVFKHELFDKDFCRLTLQDILDNLEKSCEDTTRILNDLLDFEKLESGAMKFDKSAINVSLFLREALNPYQIEALHARVELVCNFEKLNDHVIMGDAAQLRQIIHTFVSNAIHYTPSGGRITVKASVHELSPGSSVQEVLRKRVHPFSAIDERKSVVRIHVIDSGYGIAQQNISKVFNEISHFNTGELQNGGGSGLGLWIARSIAILHGGQVSVYSDGEGKGSTFILELPVFNHTSNVVEEVRSASVAHSIGVRSIDSQDPLDSRSCSLTSSEGEQSKRFIKDLNILLVDDAPLHRKMLRRLIHSKFRKLLEAEDGLQAIDIVGMNINHRDEEIDVILMDSEMPKMNGPSATKVMRNIGYRGLIIGLTGNALQADIEYFL